VLAFVVLVALVGPFAAPGDGDLVAMLRSRDTGPSWPHPFGTTMQGQDVLSQVLRAAPQTLVMVACSTALAMLIAVTCGVAAGAFGGWIDQAIGTVTGIFLVIPMLPLAIVIAGAVPRDRHSMAGTIAIVALSCWAAEARVLRAQAMSIRSSDFLAAAHAIGECRSRIVFGEFLPNMTSRVGAGVLFVAIQCVVMLTTLDFLASISSGHFALGDTTGTTWGSLLATAQVQQALLTGTWWAFAFPALALVVLATGLVLVQYGLDAGTGPQLGGARRRLGFSLPQRPELRSPLPALRDAAVATPAVVSTVARRVPLYAFVLFVAASIDYALPRLAWRGSLVAPPPTGSFWSGYGHFLGNAAEGRFGQGVPGVDQTVWSSLPYSLAVVGTATVVAFVVGSMIGLLAAWRRGSAVDVGSTVVGSVVWAIPPFAVAGLALTVLALRFHLFPLQWAYAVDLQPSWSWTFAGSAVRHAELPLLVLVVSSMGLWIVNMRALATATVNGDYVLLAQAMGLRDGRIMWRYVGRNALLPALTGLGVAFSIAIAGAPALEEVFSYAGGGWAMQQAAIRGNLPVVQAIFLAIAVSVVVVNLVVDALGVILDPRLRET